MNATKLMAVALCAATCAVTAVAEDDYGIESASSTSSTDAEPINPQPGMVFNAYNPERYIPYSEMKGCLTKLKSESAVMTSVDKGDNFSIEQIGNRKAYIGRWEGFLKCKRAATYTFVLSALKYNTDDTFSMFVNGVQTIPVAAEQGTCDANLKVGWNKVEIVCQYYSQKKPLTITYKPKSSTSEPRPLGPKDLFHDQKPEEDW